MMLFFSGVPERCWNLSKPDDFVISLKTTGAPSTNPPAVIGRDWASFTGACATPVDTPIDGACWGALSGAGSWATAEKMQTITNQESDAPRIRITFPFPVETRRLAVADPLSRP